MTRRFRRPSTAKKLSRATRMIESLEARTLLSDFIVNGTSASDVISMDFHFQSGFLVYDFTVNGVTQSEISGASGNSIALNGFGGNDAIVLNRVHFNDFVQVSPEVGNDEIVIGQGSFINDVQGRVVINQQPNQGNDEMFIDDTGASSGSNIHVDVRGDGHEIYAGSGLGQARIFPGEELASILLAVAPSTLQTREVHVDFPLPNMTIDMGSSGASSIVSFEHPSLALASTEMAVKHANWVRFDDNTTIPASRTYDITSNSVAGTTLTDIQAVTLSPRPAPASNPNTFNITGNPADRTTIEACNGTMNFGSSTSPVDLNSLGGFFFTEVHGDYNLFDNALTNSSAPFLLETLGSATTHQHIEKGNFYLTITDPDITLTIQEAGNADTTFNMAELAVDSTVRILGGTGNDTLRTTTTPTNNHLLDLDDIFVGESFFFDGRQGDNFLELNDINGNTQFGNPTYRLQQGKLVKNGQELLRYNPVNADRIFLAGSSDNDQIFFAGSPGTSVTLNGGAGNDLFSTFDQDLGGGNLPLEGVNASIFGATGFDAFTVDDTAGSGADRIDVSSSAVSYQVGSVTSTMAYDGIDSIQLFEGSGPAATFLNSKIATVPMLVQTGNGNDSVTVGGGDLQTNGWGSTTLQGGAGNDSIEFDDALNLGGGSYSFDNLNFTRGSSQVIQYIEFESQKLDASERFGLQFSLPNTINLNIFPSQMSSTTISAIGNRVTIINFSQGNLNNLSGALTLAAAGATLNLNDQNDTGNDSYTISGTQLVKTSGTVTQTIDYSSGHPGALVLKANQGVNNFTVNSLPAGMPTTITDTTGQSAAYHLGGGNVGANLLSPLTVNGPGGPSTGVVFENSQDNAPSTQTVNGGAITDGQTHNFSNVATIYIVNGGGGGTLNVNRVTIPFFADAFSQIVTIGNGNLDANLLTGCTINFAASVTVDDRLDSGNDTYVVDSFGDDTASFRKTSGAGATIGIRGAGLAVLQCNPGDNVITVNNAGPGVQIFGNGGNDRFDVLSTKPSFFAPVNTLGIGTGAENTSISPFGDSVNVSGNSKVQLVNNDAVRSLSVSGSNAKFVVPSSVTCKSLNITLTGVIDMAGGALLVSAGGTSQATLETFLTRGYNNGIWNGTNASGAINSSLANSSSLPDAVGYGLGSEIAINSIGGFGIAAGDTLVRYTYYGDADLNGKVDGADYARIDSKFNQQATLGNIGGWVNGDFDYNNKIDGADYALIDAAFNAQGTPL